MAINKGGRPSTYKIEYCEQIIEFFDKDPYEEHEDTGRKTANPPIFFQQFAKKINITVDTLHNWCKKYPEFLVAYNECKEIQKQYIITNAILGLYNAPFTIFTLKNISSMRDKQEVEHSGSIEGFLDQARKKASDRGK